MLSFILCALDCILTFSFEIWFYLSAKISNLSQTQIDYSDILLALIGIEFLLLIISCFGLLVFTTRTPSPLKVFITITILIFLFKICALIAFYLRDENTLFLKTYEYLSGKEGDLPEKYHAWKIVYYNSGVSLGIEAVLIFAGIVLIYQVNYKGGGEGREENSSLVEISRKLNENR